MNEERAWWKGTAFPGWIVTGLVSLLTWFSITFMKDRERRLEDIVAVQAQIQAQIITLNQRVPILERDMAEVVKAQRTMADTQQQVSRTMDRLAFILDEMRKVKR